MKKLLLCSLLLLSVHSFGQQKVFYTSSKFVNKIPKSGDQKTKYTYKLIPADENTFGYDIFAGQTLILHQPDMPGKTAGEGFASKDDATKVAKRVILKLEHPITQPVVSTTEFKILGIQ